MILPENPNSASELKFNELFATYTLDHRYQVALLAQVVRELYLKIEKLKTEVDKLREEKESN